MTSEMRTERINLGKRPDLMLRLEKFGILPKGNPNGEFARCSKEWTAQKIPPYDQSIYQAMAARLPEGWEDISIDELDELLETLKKKIELKKEEPLTNQDQANQKVLTGLCTVALIGIMAGSQLIAHYGVGELPKMDERDLELTLEDSYDMILQLVIHSKLLDEIFIAIAHTSGAPERVQQTLPFVLKLSAILMMIKLVTIRNPDRFLFLVEELQQEISDGLQKVERFVDEMIHTKKFSGENAEKVALFLQRGKMALDKEDFIGFSQTLDEGLAQIGISEETLTKDLKKIEAYVAMLVHSFITIQEFKEAQSTGLHQA